MSTVDLLYSDVEEQLRASVRDLLGDRAPVNTVIAGMEGDEPYDRAVWDALAHDLGVAGLALPTEVGGHGGSWREVAVVAEELGRAVTPTPFLGSVLATAAVRAAGADGLLRRLADGAKLATLAVPADLSDTSTLVVEDGWLSGTVYNVVDASLADVILVPTADGLFLVDAADVKGRRVASLDLTRPLFDLLFDSVPATKLSDDGVGARDAALRVGGAMLAAEQCGIAQRCLDMAVEYLTTRYQFGRPIGSYQALKHRAADQWAAVSQARAASRYAAACVAADDPDAAIAVSTAQAYCSPVAVSAAEECVQLHGGIGFTWEHPAHLYLKRAKADAVLLGSASRHRAQLGALVGLPPT